MNRIPIAASLWLLLLVAAAAPPPAQPAKDLVIVQDGRSDFSIVLPAAARPSEKRAAAELQSYVKQMSGAELPIITDEQPLPAHAILVGPSKHTEALSVRLDPNALGQEGFLTQTIDEKHLLVAGTGPRGTMYGVSALLEGLGVRWYTPKVTHVPQRKTVAVAPMNAIQVPAFEYREPYFAEAFDRDWAARNRVNGQHADLDESVGGKISYYPFVHTFDALVPPDLFDKHPEYFPQVGGQRRGGYVQRCLTNEDVLKLSIEAVKRWAKEHPEATIYSVSQND